MNEDTTPITAQDSFLRQYRTLDDAGVSIVLVRGREPHRIIDTIKSRAVETGKEFRAWDIVRGWVKHDLATGKVASDAAKITDPVAALKKPLDDDGNGAQAYPASYCVMSGVHVWLDPKQPHPVLLALLRQYALVLPTLPYRLRLILVVPDRYVLPDELQNDIPVLDYALPDKTELRGALQDIIAAEAEARKGEPQTYPEGQMDLLAQNAGGLTFLEAESAYSQALIRYRDKLPRIPFTDFNRHVLEVKTDAIKRSGSLEIIPPNDNQIGGLDLFKEYLSLQRAALSPEAAEAGVPAPKGALLVGPPGTGKSAAAELAQKVLELPLVQVDLGSCFGSLVGQSEANIRAMLTQLTACKPCIAFVDEVDKMFAANSGGNDSGVGSRMLGYILSFMQKTSGIFWILTANHAKNLPAPLCRPGRIDTIFSMLPPNRAERREVLAIHLQRCKQDPSKIRDMETAVNASSGYVSAELEGAVKEAVKTAFMRKMKVSGELIAHQLANMKPIAEAFPEDFAAMQQWAAANARPSSSPDAQDSPLPISKSTGPARRRIGNN